MDNDFLPLRPVITPMIYAYEDDNPKYEGLLKVGYTTIGVEQRVAQQYPTKRPDGKVPYRIVFAESAMYSDGGNFKDHDMHRALKRRGIQSKGGEWFRCTVEELKSAYNDVCDRKEYEGNRSRNFKMRPEQKDAVRKTMEYFEKEGSAKDGRRIAKFLWNAKMRFGKTFAAYQLAKHMDLSKILILTFKPAVQSAWEEDIKTHIDFEGWQFISGKDKDAPNMWEKADKSRPIVCFGSFQDFLQTNAAGGIKLKNEWVHATNWDLVIFDEYHFGAWRDRARSLFEQEDEDNYDFDPEKYKEKLGLIYDESFLPITTPRYLYLSGTPFRALNSGEFIEDQIYNWTYSDEQRAKAQWTEPPDNPYSALPRMVMMTYKIPESISQIAVQGEFNEFDLNEFFAAEGKGNKAKFRHEEYVQKWLELIRGAYLGTTTDDLKLGAKKPEMPYSNSRLLSILTHTLWFLPNVASCFAMKNLLDQNAFFHDYKINVCAGSGAGIGLAALAPVQKSMQDPLKAKTITLTCGKLITGVTVKPWTGIFMLRNLKSPETYFQAVFRVQSPWEIDIDSGKREIMKRECYVFDFALDRALRQIADYSCRLDINEGNPEKKVEEFIKFLPVIAYDGSTMKQISASDILDSVMTGTSATLLARRWESALLVNVDNDTLARLMANEAAMKALMSIEGFRSLNSEIETIINLSDKVKKAKTKDEKPTEKEKIELTKEEKEYKSKRKEIQKQLIKFATRIPIFMYLSEYREVCLKDVIQELEPEIFTKATGLGVKDFDLLLSLGVFNGTLMNDAVYKFKRYEDSSLSYTGIIRDHDHIGLFDTVLTREEYEQLHCSQQGSMGG